VPILRRIGQRTVGGVGVVHLETARWQHELLLASNGSTKQGDEIERQTIHNT